MVTIKILIYTDFFQISDTGDVDLKLSILKSLIEAKTSTIAEYQLKVINRFQDFDKVPPPPHPIKITRELLEPFDELWLFGAYQRSLDTFDKKLGGPEGELDKDELKVLEQWMNDGGGLLIAGDHSLPNPEGTNPNDPATFLGMGKALGEWVPRAGQLRKWKGSPTVLFDKTSFDSLGADFSNKEAQSDAIPQILQLTKQADGSNHFLFMGRDKSGQVKPINVFPDHLHEGQVVQPDPTKLGDKWPPFNEQDDSQKPQPAIVAFGTDQRFSTQTGVLAVYDGDLGGVGRIVADSSWHHYVDVNLKGLQAANEDGVWGLLSQFYGNLALYLAPLNKRREMAHLMIEWLAERADVLEERGNHPFRVGKVAMTRVGEIAPGSDAFELLQALAPEDKSESERLNLSPFKSGPDGDSSVETVIGSIINLNYAVAGPVSTGFKVASANTATDIVAEAFTAVRIHRDLLRRGGLARIPRSGTTNLEGDFMANPICLGVWIRSKLNTADDGSFAIVEIAGGLRGLHVRNVPGVGTVQSPLENILCDGSTISFSRTDPVMGLRIDYFDGKITTDIEGNKIKGKFRIPWVGIFADDWTAEKPT